MHELKSGTFLANAQGRASRRKSKWNLLLYLVVPVWMVLFIKGADLARLLAQLLLGSRHLPEDLIWPYAIAPLFAYGPLLLVTITPAMVLVNYFIYIFVPPARRAMDEEDKAYPGVDYATQQPLLVRISLATLPIGFALSVIGRIFV